MSRRPTEKRVGTTDLKLGMYVVHLDRPWVDTPFPFQGFHIRSVDEIGTLRQLCAFVYIDIALGEPATRYLSDDPPDDGDALLRLCRKNIAGNLYRDVTSVEEELPAAREIHHDALTLVSDIMDDVRNGRKVNLSAVDRTVDSVITSVLRNPDAFLWLTHLKKKDVYTYSHALDVCALSAAFGRHLGMQRAALQELAIGALLLDIGKMRLPMELLQHPGRLNEEEFALVKRHVAYSVELMRNIPGIGRTSTEVAATHHERHNGNGYPKGVAGNMIPSCGRIAAIVDCYDAITSDRPYAKAISPHNALRKLYKWRNVDFQDELVEHFIQCLGAYPTGTLVELNTGEVGIVIAQNRLRRLRPRVMLVLDPDKSPYSTSPMLDMLTDNANTVEIVRPLDPGTYGIDPVEFYL